MSQEESESIKILDHGYVRLIESWGSDERIIEAARMSTNKGFLGWGPKQCQNCGGNGFGIVKSFVDLEGTDDSIHGACPTCKGSGEMPGDEKLLKFLWDHKHHTPFEMAGLTVEVQAPIFVFREWHRHRTQSYNELSARYTELPDLYYTASYDRLMNGGQSQTNKQAAGSQLTEATVWEAREIIDAAHIQSRISYENLIKLGVAREIARGVIPLNQYSRMRASANLRNWLHFATLRTAGGAQWEIRQYANEVAKFVEQQFPRTYALWKEDR